MTNKLNLKILILFSLFWVNYLNGQNRFINIDSLSEQSLTFLPDKMIIGELHGISGNYESYKKIIDALNKNKHYKFIVERGLSFSYLINEYLIDADTSIINRMTFESEDERDFYNQIYASNNLLPDDKKVTVIGIDLEYQQNFAHTLTALAYYLQKTTLEIPIQQVNQIFFDNQKSNGTKIYELFKLIDTVKLSDQKYDVIVKSILSNYFNTIEVNKSSYINWGRRREKFLLKNFTVLTTDINYFCLIIGVAHLPENAIYPSFTKKLSKEATKDFKYFYPIYFNHISSKIFDKRYYCENSFDPLKSDDFLFKYFNSRKGSWLLQNKDKNYFIISN